MRKVLLEKFHMGFEFEFYVTTTQLVKAGLSCSHTGSGAYFLQRMQEVFPGEKWKKYFIIKQDGSLCSHRSWLVGVEMVFKHQCGTFASKVLSQVLEVLQEKGFQTTRDCGLHVNVSFKDDVKNTAQVMFTATQDFPFEKHLAAFQRRNNSYCRNNSKTAVSKFRVASRMTNILEKMIAPRNYQVNINLWSAFMQSLQNPAKKKEFWQSVEGAIVQEFLSSWETDRPALAPRKKKKNHYMECRIAGGSKYERKEESIRLMINDLLTRLNKSGRAAAKKVTMA